MSTSEPTEALAERTTRVPTRLGRLHVRTVGDGTPTILWSSMFVDSHSWDRLLPLLPGGRRYHLVDPPGLGLSDSLATPSNIVGAADAATDLLSELEITDPVDWVGNALGGHVGLDLATRPGVLRSLVAISSPTEPVDRALRAQIHLLLPLLRAAGPVGPVRTAIVSAMLTDASAADPAMLEIVEQSLRRPTRRSMATAIRSFILDRVDVTGSLGAIRVPSLFVASDDRGDWSPEAAANAASLAPGAEVVTVERARTLVPLEQPAQVAAHLRAWWGRPA